MTFDNDLVRLNRSTDNQQRYSSARPNDRQSFRQNRHSHRDTESEKERFSFLHSFVREQIEKKEKRMKETAQQRNKIKMK